MIAWCRPWYIILHGGKAQYSHLLEIITSTNTSSRFGILGAAALGSFGLRMNVTMFQCFNNWNGSKEKNLNKYFIYLSLSFYPHTLTLYFSNNCKYLYIYLSWKTPSFIISLFVYFVLCSMEPGNAKRAANPRWSPFLQIALLCSAYLRAGSVSPKSYTLILSFSLKYVPCYTNKIYIYFFSSKSVIS